MKGINKVIIVGTLGADPELKHLNNGDSVCNISLATNEQWVDKSGQKQQKTEWHRAVAFRRLADIMGEYLNKGSNVYIEGKLQTNKWQDQQGNDRYTTEIIVRDLQMLDKRDPGQSNQGQPNQQQQGYQQQSNQQQAPQQQQAPVDDFDDDIPFS